MRTLTAFLAALSLLPGLAPWAYGQNARSDQKETTVVDRIDHFLSGFFERQEPGGVVIAAR